MGTGVTSKGRRASLRTASTLAVVAFAVGGCMMASPSRARVGAAPPDLHAQTVTFRSASGSNIHAWLVPGRRGLGAVLLLHGVGANRTSMLGRARFLSALGFT